MSGNSYTSHLSSRQVSMSFCLTSHNDDLQLLHLYLSYKITLARLANSVLGFDKEEIEGKWL